MNEDNKEKIVLRLLDIAFFENYPNKQEYKKTSDEIEERNIAFDIIEMLDIRKKPVIDIAMKFAYRCLSDPRYCNEGPDISKVGKWLARDAKLRASLIERAEKFLRDPPEFEFASFYKKFLSDII